MKILKALSNAVDPNYWAERIGTKTGAYDKAHNSKLAHGLVVLQGGDGGHGNSALVFYSLYS